MAIDVFVGSEVWLFRVSRREGSDVVVVVKLGPGRLDVAVLSLGVFSLIVSRIFVRED